MCVCVCIYVLYVRNVSTCVCERFILVKECGQTNVHAVVAQQKHGFCHITVSEYQLH